jgi:hypothetical protein
MIAPLLPHELEIGLRQREISNQVGFADFRRKGAQASALRLGKDASRHLVPHAQAFHGRFPVPLDGLEALVVRDLDRQHQIGQARVIRKPLPSRLSKRRRAQENQRLHNLWATF